MRRRGTSALLGLAFLVSPACLPAQETPDPHVIRWWEAAAVLGGIGALMLLDAPVQRGAQDVRTTTTDDLADVLQTFGEPEVTLTVPAGMIVTGLIIKSPTLRRAGYRVGTSVVVATATTFLLKYSFGRQRPNVSPPDPWVYHPFGGDQSLPSGHTAAAFALAASLADEIHKPVATVGLYAAAMGTAWARINNNAHWLSDVAAGAAIGITTAKLVDGRWRIFGLKPPEFLVTPAGTGLGWSVTF